MSTRSSTVLSAGAGGGAFAPSQRDAIQRPRVSAFMVVGAAWGADILMLTAAGLIACAASRWPQPVSAGSEDLLLALVGAWGGMTMLRRLKSYRISVLCAPAAQARRAIAAVLAGGACFTAAAIVKNGAEIRLLQQGFAWGVAACGLLGSERVAASLLIRRWCAAGLVARRVAVVGTECECAAFLTRLDAAPNLAIDIVGLYDSPVGGSLDTEGATTGIDGATLRPLGELASDSRHADLDAVVIAVTDADAGRIDSIRSSLEGLAVDIFVAASPHMATCRTAAHFGSFPAGLIAGRPLSDWQMLQKTIFDRTAALLLLALFSPILFALAIAVRLDSRGPSLFRQTRIGLNNAPFTCFKFRSMYHASASGELLQATRGDRRVTRIGAWLRRTSIDELPQLLNVLRGEMSLVGPRPHAPNTRAAGRLFDDIVTNYNGRHRVKPGITGWAQVNGWRGETPTVESLEQRVEHDFFYVQNWSMRLDLHILLRTARVMLHDSRAY